MKPLSRAQFAGMFVLVSALALAGSPATADNPTPYPDTRVVPTDYGYQELVERTLKAVKDNRMGVVARASATVGAKSIGKDIPGNMVVMVYRPDFAVRMLAASVPAGIEAPIRLYLTEDPATGKATLTYRTPSSVFNPYGNAELDRMAKELDAIFAKIVADATR